MISVNNWAGNCNSDNHTYPISFPLKPFGASEGHFYYYCDGSGGTLLKSSKGLLFHAIRGIGNARSIYSHKMFKRC